VSIGVVCPHCELTLQLQPEMAGRSIRCPNPECRETFVVPLPFTEIVPTAKPIPTAKAVQLPSKPKEVRWSGENRNDPQRSPQPKPPVTKEVRWSEDLDRPVEKARAQTDSTQSH